jgi:hypothetical protein
MYTPAPVSIPEGQRMEAKEAAVTFCGTTNIQTSPAFLPKFTTAGAYLAYKRGKLASCATVFRPVNVCVASP